MATYMGLAVPLFGESQITQQTDASDILTITGYSAAQSGDFFVCENSAGTEKFVIDKDGDVSIAGSIEKMVIGSIALASLASNASATVALTGITTGHVVIIFGRGATTAPLPMTWGSAANVLGYGAPSVATAATTVNYWMFTTA